MIIKRGITHKINMGNYEAVHVSGEITVDTTELTLSGSDEEQLVAFVQSTLDSLLEADIAEARRNTDPDADQDSYINNWRN